jgi:hypothetical protein
VPRAKSVRSGRACRIACIFVDTAARRTVYLDLNHWYVLGDALAGRPQQPEHLDWTINDLRDITALAKAIPYCDIVITDSKAWDAAVNRAHLDREFGTKILRRLSDLAAYL